MAVALLMQLLYEVKAVDDCPEQEHCIECWSLARYLLL